MKTHLNTISFLSIISFLFLFSSCANESLDDLDNSEKENIFQSAISTENGYLVFASEDIFENFILDNVENQTNIKTLEDEWGYKSYALNAVEDKSNEELLKDIYFSAVLNEIKVVAIGDNIFKLNLESEEVYSINRSASIEDIQNFMDVKQAEQLSNNSILFGFDEDVFAILDDHVELALRSGSCINEKINYGHNGVFNSYCPSGYGFYLIAKYNKWGIWKTLRADFGHYYNTVNNLTPVHFDWIYGASWTPRCRSQQTENKIWTSCSTPPTTFIPSCYPYHSAGAGKIFYRGTRCLQQANLQIAVRFASACDPNKIVWTGWTKLP